MNDEAREVLVQAALNGNRQIKYRLHDWPRGDCAIGVLHRQCHTFRLGAIFCMWQYPCRVSREVWTRFEISPTEQYEITVANDHHDMDFLTIARKVGVPA